LRLGVPCKKNRQEDQERLNEATDETYRQGE
jgi:hypothetical protein